MNYIGDKIFRGFKIASALVGVAGCGIIVITWAVGINTIAIPISSGLALIPMGFIFFNDHKVIKDMERLITKFKAEFNVLKKINDDITHNNIVFGENNKTLTTELDNLKTIEQQLRQETFTLEQLLTVAKGQINQLTESNKEYEYNNAKLKELLGKAKTTVDELTVTTESLIEIRDKYATENSELKITATHIEMQLAKLLKTNKNYETLLQTLRENNTELSGLNHELDLKIRQLESSYDKAKETVKTLLMATGILQDLGDDMIKTEQKTSENASLTGKLLNMFGIKRTQKLFDRLDENRDGVISNDEFLNILIHADE